MTPQQLADKLDRAAQRLPDELAAAQKRVGRRSVQIARLWSSGGKTAAQLAAEDHPYATRHGGGEQNPLVNRQSGTFFAGWRYDSGRKALVNATQYGGFLQRGTAVMVGRDILGAIGREVRPIIKAEVRTAIKRSFRG